VPNIGCNAYRVGGTEDHIHIACTLPRTLTVSKLLEEIKKSSSVWLKNRMINSDLLLGRQDTEHSLLENHSCLNWCDTLTISMITTEIITFQEEFWICSTVMELNMMNDTSGTDLMSRPFRAPFHGGYRPRGVATGGMFRPFSPDRFQLK
jgi:hypothetical protein